MSYVNVITEFKTFRLWKGWTEEMFEEEMRKLQEWRRLGKVSGEAASRTLDRMHICLLELQVEELIRNANDNLSVEQPVAHVGNEANHGGDKRTA